MHKGNNIAGLAFLLIKAGLLYLAITILHEPDFKNNNILRPWLAHD